jgi:methylated-DNA-[protein]-cysteine S-methyltransferase
MNKAFLRNTFKERVIAVVKKIPKGKTLSYKQVAAKAGHSLAARAVGAIMRANKDKSVPCHRVVGTRGIGGYNGLRGEKMRLLKAEGAL